MIKSIFAKALITATAASMAIAAAAPAVAQPASGRGYYDAGGGYYYDPCKRDQTNRAVTGAIIGGVLGAVIGSNVSKHHLRTEGSVIGGGIGAVGGAAVGSSSAACTPGDTRGAYYDNGASGYADRRYDDRYSDDRDYDGGYDVGRYDRGGYDSGNGVYDARAFDDESAYRPDEDYAYDGGGRAYPVAAGTATADGCALAESAIYMPDGAVQKRFVRVCRDRSGRYQVVE